MRYLVITGIKRNGLKFYYRINIDAKNSDRVIKKLRKLLSKISINDTYQESIEYYGDEDE